MPLTGFVVCTFTGFVHAALELGMHYLCTCLLLQQMELFASVASRIMAAEVWLRWGATQPL